MQAEYSFLGTGWSFPPSFDQNTRTVQMVTDEEDIAQSLRILLSTRPGERVMLPGFGCNLDVLLFEPVTTTLAAYIKDLVETAILYFEPRIDLERVDIREVNPLEGLIILDIDYSIRVNNSRFNMVIPFYTGSFRLFSEKEELKELSQF